MVLSFVEKYCFNGRMHYDGGASLAAAAIAATATGAQIAGASKANKRGVHLAHQQMAWQAQQRELQNEWALEQWNRENEYNSPAAQIERLRQAGLSPASYLEGANGGESSSLGNGADTPQAASMPQLVNPMQNLGQNLVDGYRSFKNVEQQQKMVDAEVAKKQKETEAISYENIRRGLMFGKEFEFMGVKIELSKAQLHLTEKEAAKTAEETLAKRNEARLMMMYAAQCGAAIRYQDVMRIATEMKVSPECRKLLQDVYESQAREGYYKALKGGQINENRMRWQQNHEDIDGRTSDTPDTRRTHYGYGLAVQDSQNRYSVAQQYSDFGISLKKGMSLVSDVIDPFVEVTRGAMYVGITRAQQAQARKTMESTLNQASPSSLVIPTYGASIGDQFGNQWRLR